MPYEITPHIGIISATLTLSAAQIAALANAHIPLQQVCEQYDPDVDAAEGRETGPDGRAVAVVLLDPVCELLNQIAGLIHGTRPGLRPGGVRSQARPSSGAAQPTSQGQLGARRRLTQPVTIDPGWLREQYITLGRSTTSIGDELHCSDSTVGRYLKAYGIPVRPSHRPAKAAPIGEPQDPPAGAQ